MGYEIISVTKFVRGRKDLKIGGNAFEFKSDLAKFACDLHEETGAVLGVVVREGTKYVEEFIVRIPEENWEKFLLYIIQHVRPDRFDTLESKKEGFRYVNIEWD